MHSLLLLILTVLTGANQRSTNQSRILVQFLDRVGNREYDATYVDETVSTVEFTCFCSKCTTVHLFVVDKNETYLMSRSELSEEWKYTMKINDNSFLGEYKCRWNNFYFASYNWTYRVINDTCILVYKNSTESCGTLSEEHCQTTHSFRPRKSIMCDIRNRTVHDFFCETTAYKTPYLPLIKIVGDDKHCEVMDPMYNGIFKTSLIEEYSMPVYPYTMLLVDSYFTCSFMKRIISYGDTVFIENSYYLSICFTWPFTTNVSVWIDKGLLEVSHKRDKHFAYNYVLKQEVYRFNIVVEGKTDSNAVVRTYARFVYLGGRANITEVSKNSCVNGTRASTLLRCSVSKVHPVEKFQVWYKWHEVYPWSNVSNVDEFFSSLWSDELNVTSNGLYMCKIFITYGVNTGKKFYWTVDKKPDFQLEYYVTLECLTVSKTDGSAVPTTDITAQTENVTEIYLYIIITLSILMFCFIVTAVVIYMYKRWKKKHESKDLYGASETAMSAFEQSMLHTSQGSD